MVKIIGYIDKDGTFHDDEYETTQKSTKKNTVTTSTAPAMSVVASKPTVTTQPVFNEPTTPTTQPVVQETKKQTKKEQSSLKDAIKAYGDVIKNSAVKNHGLSVSNVISDLANAYDARRNIAASIPGVGKVYDTGTKTLGNIATNMGEGALKTGEGVLDTLNDWADAINNPLTYQANKAAYGKKTADKALKESQKAQEQFLKTNLVDEMNKLTGYNDILPQWEQNSLVKRENLGGQVAQGVGGMVPSLLAGQYLGFAPQLKSLEGLSGAQKAAAMASNVGRTYVSQLPANAILGASSYGSGLEEALNDGATRNQARAYGLTNAAIEQGTEMLTGGVPGLEGKGGLDQFVDPLINRNTNGYLNALLRAGYGAFGEGLEEYTSAMLEPLARKIYSDEDINWDEVRKQARQAGLTGAITGAILNSPSNIQDIKNVRTENQIRNVLGDSEYAEGNSQYNPDYKGWKTQREENRIENEQKIEENNQRREEVKRFNQERAQEEARKAQELAQEEQKEQERLRQQEVQKQATEQSKNVKNPELNADIKDFRDVKSDYGIYKRFNPEKFDYSMLDKAKETIEGSKKYGRTKQEWLDVAKNIGLQAENMDSNALKKYAFESYAAADPYHNMNKQGQKVSFGIHEWVKAVYDGARVGTPLETQQATQVDNKTQQQIQKFIERGGRVEDSVPEGFIKTEGATTAPKGYTWYNNGKSRFGGEYENVLVKDSGTQEQSTSSANNLAAEKEEPVLKIETPQQEKQHFVDNGMKEETAKILSEMPKVEKQPLRERIKEGKAKLSEEWSYLKRNLVDKGETIYNLGKKTKNPNLYAKYDKRGTTTGEANYDIGVAQTDLQGKRFNNFTNEDGKKTSMSLNQIWEGVDPKFANEYLAHYLNVDRYNQLNQDGTQKYVFGESITDKDSLQRIKQLEKEHPELKRFGENVWQYGKNQLQNMVDAGKISQAQADQFLRDTPHYVRLQRNVENTTTPLLEFDKKGNVKVNKNIKEFKGSTLDILPFKESMAQYTLDVRNSIRDNIFAQELAKTLGVGADGGAVTDIEDIFGTNPDLLKDNGDGTYSLTFFNKGVATTIPINQGIYESLQPNKHFKFEDTLPFKGIRKFDSVRKALLTDKNPMFLATNMMKDAFDAPLNSKYPVSFVKNYPRAFYEILRGGKNYQQYQALGGLQNSYFDNQQFQKQGSKLNPLTWIEKANNAIEQIPRLAEFMSTMEKTGDVDQAMYNAAEVTTNFKRGGDVTKAANRNGATFLNASVQGFSKQIRNFTDIQSPKQAVQMLGKVLTLGIAPGLLNDLMWDDDDEYKEMQDYQKDRYYLFKGKDGQWIRIPKGRAVSIFQSAARRTKYAMRGEDDAFKDFGKFASSQVAPNNPFENNIISPIVDVSRNESWSGNKIIPTSYEKKKAEKQYNEKTDKLSRKISEEINKSEVAKKIIPKNFRSAMGINYLIDQYSGAIGDITLPYITPKVSTRNRNPLSAPVLDKFTTDSVYSNKSVNSFYDTMNKLAEEDETPIDVAKNNYMTSKSIALSQLYKEQRNIQNNESLSKDEKYEKAREVQKEINKFTKDTVKNVNNIEQEEYYLKIGDDYYKRVIKDGEEKYIKDSSKKIPTGDKYALYDYFREKYEKSKEEKK